MDIFMTTMQILISIILLCITLLISLLVFVVFLTLVENIKGLNNSKYDKDSCDVII